MYVKMSLPLSVILRALSEGSPFSMLFEKSKEKEGDSLPASE